MQIKLYHSLAYTTNGLVPVHLVAKSLLANERLIHESLRILEGLETGFQISSVQISVAKLSNESPLKEFMAIALIGAYQHDLEKEVPQLIQTLTGHHIPDGQATVVTVLVFLVALYLIDAAIERLMPGKSVKAIKAEYEEKIHLAAKMLSLAPERIEEVICARFDNGRNKSLVNKVYDFFSPAKIESGTEIVAGKDVSIKTAAIQEIPSTLDVEQLEAANSYPLDAAVIEIHRADRDENKHGWRAIIQDVSDKKIRMELDPSINPDELYGKKIFRGNVMVIEELQDGGDYQIKAYNLLRVIE